MKFKDMNLQERIAVGEAADELIAKRGGRLAGTKLDFDLLIDTLDRHFDGEFTPETIDSASKILHNVLHWAVVPVDEVKAARDKQTRKDAFERLVAEGHADSNDGIRPLRIRA